MITKHPKSILLADDSIFFRTKLSAILADAGHRVSIATDGNEVLGMLQSESSVPDLLILDLKMPKIDGFSVLQAIKERGLCDRMKTLAITGVYEPSEVVGRLRELGAVGLVTKGITPEQLLNRVNHILFPEKATEKGLDRIPVSLHAYFLLKGATQTGFILNISPTGLFIHTEAAVSLGEELDITFNLSEDWQTISVTGMVQWVTPPSEAKGIFAGAGIVFTGIKDDAAAAIDRFIKSERNKRKHSY